VNSDIWRLGIFIGLLATLMLAEHLWPRRTETSPSKRWVANLSLFALGLIASRLLVLVAALSAASWAGANGFGLLNLIDLPIWVSLLIAVIIMDFAVWAQHVATHLWPPLWRLHRMHHSDTQMDVTTALRFHPVEIALSLIYKAVIVAFLGAPVVAVIMFEALLNSCAMFNHSNINLPRGLDRYLRKFIATPDMHRVHHSTPVRETNSNYATFLTLWDYLFGTYIDQPAAGHLDGDLGLEEFREPKDQRLTSLLCQPAHATRLE